MIKTNKGYTSWLVNYCSYDNTYWLQAPKGYIQISKDLYARVKEEG